MEKLTARWISRARPGLALGTRFTIGLFVFRPFSPHHTLPPFCSYPSLRFNTTTSTVLEVPGASSLRSDCRSFVPLFAAALLFNQRRVFETRTRAKERPVVYFFRPPPFLSPLHPRSLKTYRLASALWCLLGDDSLPETACYLISPDIAEQRQAFPSHVQFLRFQPTQPAIPTLLL